MANPTNQSLNYLLQNPETDNNKNPLNECPFFRSKRNIRLSGNIKRQSCLVCMYNSAPGL